MSRAATFAGRLAAAAVLTAGVTGGVTVLRHEHPAPISADPASDVGPVATTSVRPVYLPAGATLVSTPDDPRYPSVAEAHYALPGPANADTIPAGGLTAETALTAHTSTELVLTFVPGLTTPPSLPADPAFFDVRNVTVAGLPALLSTPKNGFGVHRVDWIDAAGYHVVLCERLATPQGTSGLPASELLRVAASLYT